MQNVPFAAQQEQVNKFLAANRALGAQMDSMQGTTRAIYDTFNFNTFTSYDFFTEVSSKQSAASNIAGSPATNITDNRFEPGEGMVIKEIGFCNLEGTPANILNISGNAYASLALINVYVGNSRVIKDLPLSALGRLSHINNINNFGTTIADSGSNRYAVARLFTNIVIPPQIQFYVNVRFPLAPASGSGTSCLLRCYLKGYGKLFNPRNNY